MISVGCALAAYGELHFELSGFICQCAAVAFEASRLVMIQILLHGLKVSFLEVFALDEPREVEKALIFALFASNRRWTRSSRFTTTHPSARASTL